MKILLFCFFTIVSIALVDVCGAQDNLDSESGILDGNNHTVVSKKIYKVDADFGGIKMFNSKPNNNVPKEIVLKQGTKIHIKEVKEMKGVVDENPKRYIFRPINQTSCTKSPKGSEGACDDKLYYFTSDQNPHLYLREWNSIAHGTLVVPFKYRTRDGRLTGDSTLGYFLGLKVEFYDLDFIPLITFGLSAISTPGDETDTDTELGVTAAIGLVLKHSGNFQMGIISGIDHIGGDNSKRYKYQDDLWLSFMIGYNFAQ